MNITIERSGGLAGISSSSEIAVDKLPPSLGATVRNLLERKKSLLTMGSGRPKGSADYMVYKITIQNGKEVHVIECNEFDMNDRIKSLVNYVQKNSLK